MDYMLSTVVWNQILNFLKSERFIHTKDEQNLRIFMEAIWFILRSGCQWRLLPSYYGNWRSVHKRYKQWSDKGIWTRLMESVSDIDGEAVMLDSTIVRAHACASGYQKNGNDAQALGRSKGGFTTKIHALVDALGNPIKFIVTPGQRNDITQAETLLQDTKNTIILGDKGYYSTCLTSKMEGRSCNVVIPCKKNSINKRLIDSWLYKERHLIENFFSKIKHFRRVFSRFDKTVSAFLGFIHLAGTLIWTR